MSKSRKRKTPSRAAESLATTGCTEGGASQPTSAHSWQRDILPLNYTRKTTGQQNRKAIVRDCKFCGNPFKARIDDVKRGWAAFCGKVCAGKFKGGNPAPVVDAPKKLKVRANGLINMRVRRGIIERPTACEQCTKRCTPDGHHEDYDTPGNVRWLCRSCHMKVHFGTLKLSKKGAA